MTALLYFLVAVLAVGLSVGAFVEDRQDPARQAFVAFGGALGAAYVGFSLSLLPGLGATRTLYLLAGSAVPPTALWTFERCFLRDEAADRTPGFVYVGTAVVAPICALGHAWWSDGLAPSPWSLLAGVWNVTASIVALQRLWTAQERTHLRIDKLRMRWLFGVVTAAAVFTVVEQLGRLFAPVDPATLSVSSRAVALQGPIPPISAIFAGLSTYFLYHTVVMSRLLDVTELLSRIATVLLSALVLVLVDGLTFQWVDTFTVFPLHSTFQIFLASILFLAAYDPLRSRISWWANRAFDRRSHQLDAALDQLERLLPTMLEAGSLVGTILDALNATGRATTCSIYLWDPHRDAFVCAGFRGQPAMRPLSVVSAHPFTDRFERGAPWYLATTVRRRAQHDAQHAEILALMQAMNADLTFPLMSGQTVLGWLHLADEAWSDGYSAEQILHLQAVTQRASVVLANLESFAAIEEQKRLAALGAMSAGLAHEIRNPLAGVKGAAQFLQHDPGIQEESREMLQIIVDETDRLNGVVSEFLDYARPFELRLALEPLNDVVGRTTALLGAEGLPGGIRASVELDHALPLVPIDASRMGQVMLNLARNAIQAMAGGGVLGLRTRLGRDRTGRRGIEVLVSDTGTGIEPEVLSRLFVPFYTTKSDGTGLGLAICQRIVQAHGGSIDVASTPGEGTTFLVFLPLPADPPTADEEGR